MINMKNMYFFGSDIRCLFFFGSFFDGNNLQMKNSLFSGFLARAIYLNSGPYVDLVQNSRLNSISGDNGEILFRNCRFQNIHSSESGSAFYANLVASIEIDDCSFYSLYTSQKYAAFYISSSITSAIINRICLSKCKAQSEVHAFMLEPAESYIDRGFVFMCSTECIGSFGSMCFRKPKLITNINSSSNSVLNHGAAFYIYEARYSEIRFISIQHCVGKAIERFNDAYHLNLEYHNLYNITCLNEDSGWNGALQIGTTCVNVSYRYCSFVSMKGKFTYSFLATFYNCSFDNMSPFTGCSTINGNKFASSGITTFFSMVYSDCSCNQPFYEYKSTKMLSINQNRFILSGIIVFLAK